MPSSRKLLRMETAGFGLGLPGVYINHSAKLLSKLRLANETLSMVLIMGRFSPTFVKTVAYYFL